MGRIAHDESWDAAKDVVGMVASRLTDEEDREFFAAVYNRIQQAIEQYEAQVVRRDDRLHPLPN